jgi:osmotically-inducible protein OsmY
MKQVWSSLAVIVLAASSVAYAQDTNTEAAPVAKHRAHLSKAERAADRKLASAVRKAIEKGGDVDVSHLTVTARSGKVTLSGYVPDSGQADAAKQKAQGVQGVTEVASRLGLGEPGR